MEFGEGLLNKGKAKKREKRPLTQIEIMAAVEREKQEKKAARRAAKVRATPRSENRLTCVESARNTGRVARDAEDFSRHLRNQKTVFSEPFFLRRASTRAALTSRRPPPRVSPAAPSSRVLRKPRLRRARSAWISS